MNNIKVSSNRNFGIVFFLVFFLISIYPLIKNENVIVWLFLISIASLILGLLNSRILTPFNYAWINFGLFLSKFFSPIIMGIIFFLVITPIGLFMKIFKKDLLNLKFNKTNSYWVHRKKQKTQMKDQF